MMKGVAGIRFFLKDQSVSAAERAKFQGQVILGAHFDSMDIWNDVIERLNNLEVYRGSDIQSELITILQGQVDMLEKELEARGTSDRERAQRAEQAASISSADAVRSRQHAELLKAQIEVKDRELADTQRAYQEALKANQAWQAWFEANRQALGL